MKTRKNRLAHVCLVVVMLLGMAFPGVSSGGLLDDYFGVVPTLESQTYNYNGQTYYHFDSNSLIPTLNTDSTSYKIGDWNGYWNANDLNDPYIKYPSGPSGGEPYDVEAAYFGSDANNLYVAIITSFPPPEGRYESRDGYPLVVSGDLALDLGLNDPHSATDPFRYDYGININNEQRQKNGDATSGGDSIGTGLYRTKNDDWYLGSPDCSIDANGEWTNFDPNYSSFSGTHVGEAEEVDYYAYDFARGQLENGFETYVIEATIPRSLFGDDLTAGTLVGVSYLPGCRNDVCRVEGRVGNETPEPGALIVWSVLFGIGCVGYRIRHRRAGQVGQ